MAKTSSKANQIKLGPAPGSLEYALAMGRQLLEMRGGMTAEEFEQWVDSYCPFPWDTAVGLMDRVEMMTRMEHVESST